MKQIVKRIRKQYCNGAELVTMRGLTDPRLARDYVSDDSKTTKFIATKRSIQAK